jgi:hypothetical protein
MHGLARENLGSSKISPLKPDGENEVPGFQRTISLFSITVLILLSRSLSHLKILKSIEGIHRDAESSLTRRSWFIFVCDSERYWNESFPFRGSLLVKKKLVHDTEEEMKYVREGLNEIVQHSSLLMLSAQDIALALSGNCDLDVSEVFLTYSLSEYSNSKTSKSH